MLPYTHEKFTAAIPYSTDIHARLNALVHDRKTLQTEGYKFQSFGDDEIRRMWRCRDCHGIFHSLVPYSPDFD